MKTIIKVFVSLLLVSILSSCTSAKYGDLELPPGVWRSDNPNIVLYVESEYQSSILSPCQFLGIYTTEHNKIKLFTSLHIFAGTLTLQRADSLDLERGGISNDGKIFEGRFEVIDGEMHYALVGQARNPTGEVIIFRRCDDYEPINPDDWFR